MGEQKVKVVFEFDRKDYENVLFLLDQKQDKDTEQAWETMISEEVSVSSEMIAKKFQMSQKEVLVIFASIALMWAQDKIYGTNNKR